MNRYLRVLPVLVCSLLLVALCLGAGCSSGDPSRSPAAPSGTPVATTMISIKHGAFNPVSAITKAGTTITWINDDPSPHRIVSGTGAPESLAFPEIPMGGLYSYTFTLPGNYTYYCADDPGISGTIVVKP